MTFSYSPCVCACVTFVSNFLILSKIVSVFVASSVENLSWSFGISTSAFGKCFEVLLVFSWCFYSREVRMYSAICSWCLPKSANILPCWLRRPVHWQFMLARLWCGLDATRVFATASRDNIQPGIMRCQSLELASASAVQCLSLHECGVIWKDDLSISSAADPKLSEIGVEAWAWESVMTPQK